MKIVSLKAENVKRLRAVEIKPTGSTVLVTGKNGAGKSSVLDAIWMALAGAAGTKETPRPIRDGEEKASVQLDLGDLVVTRRWTRTGTTLEVAAADGAKYSSPQTLLDSLIGRLTFDPLAFAQQDPRRQREMLLEMLELDYDPDAAAAERKITYDERTLTNREVKRIETMLAEVPTPPEDVELPREEISAAELAAELEDATRAQRDHQILLDQLDDARQDVAAAQEALAAAERRLKERQSDLKRMDAEVADAAPPPDLEPIRERLAQADATNRLVRGERRRQELHEQLEEARAESRRLTERMDAIDRDAERAVAEAAMPIDGLSFDDDGVLYNGVPLVQASSSERLRVSMAVAMALNPKIRVIRVADGSLLDQENLALIEEMVEENGWQAWVERVDESGEVGVVIEDGQVKERRG